MHYIFNKAFILSLLGATIGSTSLLMNSSLADAQVNRSSSDQPKKIEERQTRGSGSLGNYTSSDKPKKVEQRRTVGSGSRSSCQSSLPENSITLLIPEAEVVHRSSVSRPSFFLQSNVALKNQLKFTLVNPQVSQPIVENSFLITQSGITKIELPKGINLEQGKVYLWYVAIPCDDSKNAQLQEILASSVEFVPVSSKVQADLESVNTDMEIAIIYFENGFWYDALAFSIESSSDYLQDLLSSINLK